MKNKLSDLNNHLFQALERLNDEDMDPEQIKVEAARADAIVKLSDQIIGGAELSLKAAKLFAEHGDAVLPMLPKVGNAVPAGKQIGDAE